MSAPAGAESRREGRLVVVRDRAHARDVGRGASVWTFADLCERLAAWALLDPAAEHDVVRDDRAPLWATAASLARGDALLPRIAHDADDLRRAVVHGGATAAEVAQALPHDATGRVDQLAGLFSRLADAERRLAEAGRIDGAQALGRASLRLQRGELPAALRVFSEVAVLDLVEPTDLELLCITSLARAGVVVRVSLPVDPLGRGLLAGVEPVLARLEATDDRASLELDLIDVTEPPRPSTSAALVSFTRAFYGRDTEPEAPVEVLLAADEAAEAREIAAVVAAWRRARLSSSSSSPPSSTPRAGPRIAVAFRTLDAAAARVAGALEGQGVPVRLPRRPLIEMAAARLLVDVVALARDGAPRDRLLAILTSPALAGALSSSEGARVLRVLRRSAARTDVEDEGHPTGGYRHRLERYRSGLDDAAEQADVDATLVHVERALRFAARLPRQAPLTTHVDALARLADEILDDGAMGGGTALGCAEVKDLLAESRAACTAVARPGDGDVALAAFATLIERALERAQGPAPLVEDDDAVEVLALPQLWARHFDHVVIAGLVEGRVPRAERKERLLADADRVSVNRAVGRPVLRLLDDNPLERSPVPRAQALEPLWMLGALRAASSSVLLSAPRRDSRGRELAPSVFLLEAVRALGGEPSAGGAGVGMRFAREPSPREMAVHVAHRRARGLLDDEEARAAGVPPDLLERADLFRRMSVERARFFFRKAKTSLVGAGAPFAFAVDPARIERVFSSSFGLSPERPLTPTRLEALAECRMHGFLQHVLKVDVDPPAGNTADARVIGTLAHAVMERFFLERRASGVPAALVTDADRRRVRALLAEEAAPFLAGRATGHLGAIRAQLVWLETALVRAVSMLARDPKVPGVEPVDFEVQIGARQGDRPPSLGSVPLVLHDESTQTEADARRETARTIWVGGIIDRVDESPHFPGSGGPQNGRARAVIDYKTASTGSVRRKVHKDALFETHFQLLLYLRLLEHHRPSGEGTALHGYLVSLRDGTTSDDVHALPDLRARVLDDTRSDGLAAGVGRVVLPILAGTLPPDAGDRCDGCRLQRVCRVPLAAEFAPDLDDSEEGGGT